MDVKNMTCKRDVWKWYIQYHEKPGSARKYLRTRRTRVMSWFKNYGELSGILHFTILIVTTVNLVFAWSCIIDKNNTDKQLYATIMVY